MELLFPCAVDCEVESDTRDAFDFVVTVKSKSASKILKL